MPDSRAPQPPENPLNLLAAESCNSARWRRLGRFLLTLALTVWFVFAALVLALRFIVLPGIAEYRPEIEAAASRAVGQEVRIGKIEAGWKGLNPDLILDDVVMLDANALPALSLGRVESVLSWRSVWQFKPILSLLALDQPVLHVKRDRNGKIRIAGVEAQGEGDPAFADWLLAQRRIRIRNASIVWEDHLRAAPPLALSELNFGMDNTGERHRFGLTAAPPAELAAHIDLRGEVHGNLSDALESYSGKIYLEMTYADLAGWKPWLDYPIDLPRGRGGMRVWGQLADGEVAATADVALEDLRVRLSDDLPALDLSSLRGRIEAMYGKARWSVAGRRVEWLTRDGIRMAPNDFKLRWEASDGEIRGNASALLVDVGTLRQLAAYLPLDAGSRKLLAAYQPQGRLEGVQFNWTKRDDALTRYALVAAFNGLGVQAQAYFPGASGLSGKIDATEAGGRLSLDSKRTTLSLPAVFPEPDIVFDTLAAGVSWRHSNEAIDISIDRVAFSGNDATGKAHGNYRYTGSGPGEIDLQAEIERANGTAVWRYMPHVVNASARDWIRRGIVAGSAYDGRLVLRGNLRDFPFRDPSTGKFEVTAKARGAKIDYADGWPVIEDIDGEMHFDYGMSIRASRGRILGADLSNVTVGIPDFDVSDEMLLVRGEAAGPTAEFLKFIDASPVAHAIDYFTDGMKAYGRGRLNLNLDIPLRRPEQTRVRGQYHFQNDQLNVVEGLPLITQVNGRLDITETSVAARDIAGFGFGGPLVVQVGSQDGKVAVLASGTAKMAEVSRHFGWPLINHLSGSARWKADIAIKNRQATVAVSSDLVGVSSPLPASLNKTAESTLPLMVERSVPAEGVEQYRIVLGKVAQGLIMRRNGRWNRGVFAVGDVEPALPEKGLAVRVNLPGIDADAWRNYLPVDDAAQGDASQLPLTLVQLASQEFRLFGRNYHQFKASLIPQDSGWKIALALREAEGELFWRARDDGWLEGHLQRLSLSRESASGEASSPVDSLPGMNLKVDDLRIGERRLGALQLLARNQSGKWWLDRLNLQNDDAQLDGKGFWQRGAHQSTQLDFTLNAKDIGGLLGRLGYEDSVRQGKARLEGNLRWNGPLTAIDYASLSGGMTLKAEKGQFRKLEPGVGRLLGLISLQSLPRRLTLDFHDLFSAGLAFDSIDSKLAVERGVMRTQESLNINGPAVQVAIDGETDLQRETQDLNVLVKPEVGSLAAVGTAALINPVAGAAALVANTVLQRPLSRLFSYRYHVTGTWDEPLVDKAPLLDNKPAASEERTGQ